MRRNLALGRGQHLETGANTVYEAKHMLFAALKAARVVNVCA